MIFLDKPYVSEFLIDTIKKNAFPVVNTEGFSGLNITAPLNVLSEDQAIRQAPNTHESLIYTTSENAIGWIAKHLGATGLPQKIDLFKNKSKFRNLLKPIYPDFYFKEVPFSELDHLCLDDIPTPFIIKPTIGFFSMGVYKVTSYDKWMSIKESIKAEIISTQNLYPNEVFDSTSFIIEQCIEGDEFAIDAYFDAAGNPVILNIYNHIFSSHEDVSDRVYISSKKIIESNIQSFTEFLKTIGHLSQITSFPVHVEIRRDTSGIIRPIEVNPMRFGGWCSTADATYLAYGFNPYECYFSQTRPDWDKALNNKEGKVYSIIVLDNSTGLDSTEITSFNYDKLLSKFEKPLELRKLDHIKYPIFGFLFTETKEENMAELEWILRSSLTEFVIQ